jgi:beta-lactamase regulating signal transducer with metallopeptidase domain
MTPDEHQMLMSLREELRKDMSLAIANFKVWLLVTVLSNVVLVGAPAFYVFVSTASVADTALALGSTNSRRLDDARDYHVQQEGRLQDIEKFLADKYGFRTRENGDPLPP